MSEAPEPTPFRITLRPSRGRLILGTAAIGWVIFVPVVVAACWRQPERILPGIMIFAVPSLVAGVLTNLFSGSFYAFEITPAGIHHQFLRRWHRDMLYPWPMIRGVWRGPVLHTVWMRVPWLHAVARHMPSRRMLANGAEVARAAAEALREHGASLPAPARKLLKAYAGRISAATEKEGTR